ncbi:MAG: chalcone isomerase family protein [Candidatus Sumerlaeia bacterium]|nr:chalcone isomerase family protein [Candidatus Sumerlaeia bacterium]
MLQNSSLHKILPLGIALAAMLPARAGEPPAPEQICYEKVCFPEEATLAGETLPALGVGRLTWLMMDIYWAVLYTPAGADTPEEVLADVPKSFIIEYNRSFDADDFVYGSEKLMKRNKRIDLEAIRPRLDQMNALYRPVKAGDRYEVRYEPGVGTTLLLNGEALGTVPGSDFAEAYFRIWLDEKHHVSGSLREQLLGLKTSKNVRRDVAQAPA